MESGEKEKARKLTADLVIIGGGTSGLPAAVEAAEQGCKSIVVLEKLGITGGNAHAERAGGFGGIFAVESPLQRRTGNVVAGKEEFFQKAMRWAHWDIDPRIVRAFIDKSGDTIRWFEEKGATFTLRTVYANQSPLIWHVATDESGGRTKGSRPLMQILEKNCLDLGVKIFKHTEAKKILTKKGRISGVQAVTKEGELNIETRSVIIATGGFAHNKKLLKKYFQNYHEIMVYHGVPNTGDGLSLAAEVGAAIEDSATMIVAPFEAVKSVPLAIDSQGPYKMMVNTGSLFREPNVLKVNKKGRRFTGFTDYIDQAAPPDIFIGQGYATVRQPDGICYALFDDKIRQTMEESGLYLNRGVARVKLPGLKKQLKIQADNGALKMADSWEEIAEWMEVNPEILKTEIEEYNNNGDQGYDPVFAQSRKFLLPLRQPPYYAGKCCGQFLDTIGGIRINEKMEVLDNQYDPIPGLYAVGVTTSGWESKIYCYVLSGEARGFAVNSGRIAGESAARYLAK